MALFSGEQRNNSENRLRENKTKQIIYQMNSSDIKISVEKMKKSIEEITGAMESARNATYEKKIEVDKMEINLSRKKAELRELQDKLEHAIKYVESNAKKASDLEMEINKIKIAIEKIKEVGQTLDPKYLEQSQNDLINFLVKVTSEAEKAQSNLNVAKKIEEITSKKLHSIEIEFNELEARTLDKTNETERMIANVSITTEHIIKSYNEIAIVSKELLKSAMGTKIEFEEEHNYELEQSQPYQEFRDVKMAI